VTVDVTTPQLLEALSRTIPEQRLVTDRDVVASLSADDAEWAPVGSALAALRARSEAEVQEAVRVCADLRVPVVPRGAGTGLSGGANAVDGCLVLDLSRMDQVVEIDADNLVCVVQPGIVNDDLKALVREQASGTRRTPRARRGRRSAATWRPTRGASAASSTASPATTSSVCGQSWAVPPATATRSGWVAGPRKALQDLTSAA